jgi:hypothetical protein
MRLDKQSPSWRCSRCRSSQTTPIARSRGGPKWSTLWYRRSAVRCHQIGDRDSSCRDDLPPSRCVWSGTFLVMCALIDKMPPASRISKARSGADVAWKLVLTCSRPGAIRSGNNMLTPLNPDIAVLASFDTGVRISRADVTHSIPTSRHACCRARLQDHPGG